ncbi:putative serine threonine- kinase yakA isoform X5 [Brachionus plicatilis]|uniref:Putative serine threonine-kinase yakA isoform X5 n=1 Tax=Brachionus plicatilis TaxID=10195 RepID=A0A3M7SK09_BRAPC|nr:putative serine threonine- kinase yakA isoform X5 [Brachionus plicatilis]
MPPKTLFTKEDDELLLDLFRTRVQNNWSEAELERQFKQSTGRKITFKTLKARLNVKQPVQSSITISYANVRPGTSASFLNSEICLPVDQPMSFSHERNLTDQLLQLHNDTMQDLNITRAMQERIRREIETPEQTQERQIHDAQSQRKRRANETSAELDVRLNSDAARDRNRKGNETPEQKADRLQKAAERDRKKPKNKVVETEQERMDRLGLIVQQLRQQRHTLSTHMLWSILRQTIEEVDDQGELINVCEFCGALYWSGEVNSA